MDTQSSEPCSMLYRDSADVFAGRSILVNHPNFCEKWMNRYAEIADLFKNVVVDRFERTLDTGSVDAFLTDIKVKFVK